MLIFAPTSAATAGLAQLDVWPQLRTALTCLWNVMIWLTSILAVYGTVFLHRDLAQLRRLRQDLDKHFAAFARALDAVYYIGADCSEWAKMARQATEGRAELQVEIEFGASEQEEAWAGTLAAFDKYFEK